MNDGNAISNGRASTVADAGPMLNRSTTARRVPSASALKTSTRSSCGSGRLGMCLTIRLANT